jgi:hypothetical protein
MITWLPVTLGFVDGVDCGLALADGVGAVLGEPRPGADDVAGGADDAVPAVSSLQAAAPSDTMPKVTVASRVATFLTEIPFAFMRYEEWDGARDVLVRTGST